MKKLKFTESKPDAEVRLDLGAGKGLQTPDGFTPVDIEPWKGIKVADLTKLWPWKTSSVEEVHCSMLVHYLTAPQRVHFFNELHRVLKPGKQAHVITPMWSSYRAYIDVLAQWPPVGEGFYHTLNKAWRDAQNCVDRSGLKCDFDPTIGYGLHPAIMPRNEEFKRDAMQWYKEAAQDLHVTLTKRG